MSENIIWTTKYCPFCDKAKGMMEQREMKYETRLVGGEEGWTLDNLLAYAPDAKTFPQVWVEGKYIGGCDDLGAYFALREMDVNAL